MYTIIIRNRDWNPRIHRVSMYVNLPVIKWQPFPATCGEYLWWKHSTEYLWWKQDLERSLSEKRQNRSLLLIILVAHV